MYYIRLDSIVTVVDAERLGYSLVSGDSHFGVSAMSQIINSDVIVLNKTDILSSEAMEIVKKYISEISPHSKVIPTEYCQVPLQFILDIQDVTTGSQGVSHDRSNILYKERVTGHNQKKFILTTTTVTTITTVITLPWTHSRMYCLSHMNHLSCGNFKNF
eukprot:TRINITY_DN8082_c0_g1_i15.p1 TRINITY_DN8082_c0_g1~~TRINITY_DN8082_c0_g1_i15.p1  ORF type:complete len:160 (-),score=23.55 TRINITY_DN8082_c0_g1_i15:1044-1523(-)